MNPLLSVPVALIFDGGVNPAHPKHIGSIDPSCDVVEVVKGERLAPPTCGCARHLHQLYLHSCFLPPPSPPPNTADAYETSKMLCEQYYLTSPDMEITEVNCTSLGNGGRGGGALNQSHLNQNLLPPHSQEPPPAVRHRLRAVPPLPHAV